MLNNNIQVCPAKYSFDSYACGELDRFVFLGNYGIPYRGLKQRRNSTKARKRGQLRDESIDKLVAIIILLILDACSDGLSIQEDQGYM